MTEIAQQLTARIPGFLGLGQRLRAAPTAYRAADRGLWVFAAVLIVLAGLLPLYAQGERLHLAQQSLTIGLLALSLNLLVATTGLISFGHAMFFGMGAYMVAIPYKHLEWAPLAGFGLTPVIGAVGALAVGFIVFRGKELYFALLTLGVGQLVWAIAHGTQSFTGGQNGITGIFAADYLNAFQKPKNLYWFIFGVTLVCTALIYVITRSPFGDALRGIRENRLRAEFAGLWVRRYELTAFVIAGTFGAIAGGLWTIGETNITSSQIDWQQSAIALIVCLIGGTSYFLGPFAGAVFYLYVFDYVIDRTVLWDTVLGIIVLGVALTLAGGLGGLFHWLFALGVTVVRRTRGIGEALAAVAVPAAVQEVVHLPDVEPVSRPISSAATMEGSRSVLEARNITKSFGGLVAVDDVSLVVREGALHAIIGPNGAGKTTFFNVVTGLMEPDSGQVVLEGEEVTGTAPWRLVKRGLGRSFQQTNLFWALSSLDNVTLAEAAVKDATLRMAGTHSPTLRERSLSLLERVGLRGLAGIAAIELSHGDQRSLEIATALAVESRLLLLDEPTAGLSPAETMTAIALIRKIAKEQNLTVLFVEHDMEVVFRIADWITVLHRGAVLAEGPPATIRANPDVQRAYLGEVDDEETRSA